MRALSLIALYCILCAPVIAWAVYNGITPHWPSLLIAWWFSLAYGVAKAVCEVRS